MSISIKNIVPRAKVLLCRGSTNGRRHYLLLLIIVLMGWMIRIIHLDRESLWLDEVYSILFVADRSLGAIISDTFLVDFHPFGYYAFLKGWFRLLGDGAWATRFLSVIFGCVHIATTYWLARSLFRSRAIALTSALLASLAPVAVHYSQETRMYVMLMTLWPVCLGILWKSYRSRPSLGWGVIFILVGLLFLYTHDGAGVLALPLLGFWMIWGGPHDQPNRRGPPFIRS
ncbi:MAG: glycosyltransferase family 39 protein [Lentisphaerae bacterium]|nr:glycosyltransferase family 39 protein [Lentisphaerota bacterium]